MDGNLVVTGTITGSNFPQSNLVGGDINEIVYQSAPSITAFITAPTTAGTALTWNGTQFIWSAAAGGSPGGVANSLQFNDGAGGFGGACTLGNSNITWLVTGTRYGTLG